MDGELTGRINIAVGPPASLVGQADSQDARVHRLDATWRRGEAVEGEIEGQQGIITGSRTAAGVGVDCGGVAVIEALHDDNLDSSFWGFFVACLLGWVRLLRLGLCVVPLFAGCLPIEWVDGWVE